MAVIKCKMCGGDLSFEEGASVCECEYCGSKQTIPNIDDEKKGTLFGRAGRLLRACEFDKASGIYEQIIADFPEEAEAYWGLVLCRYGIEYVDDPATGRKVPTCHRSSFESVMEDSDFEQACENADGFARKVYREQAKEIEELRKGIIEISGKEEPYDIFISYKEKDDIDERTLDSVLAQDIYDALTNKGYRVFFSRISLEDKLGVEYEPYIFAALNSAKVMLVVGTDYDNFNAVWVKNEWSRFLKLMAQDKSKHLIPCFKGIDAYDMPKEFNKLTAQDLGKVGAVQDLIYGIGKLLGKREIREAVVQQSINIEVNIDVLLQRGNMALEDGAFIEAKDYFNRVLDNNPKCAEAYLGLFMTEIKATNHYSAKIKYIVGDYTENHNWKRAKQYAVANLSTELDEWEHQHQARLEKEAEVANKALERRAKVTSKERKDKEIAVSQNHSEIEERIRKEAAAKKQQERGTLIAKKNLLTEQLKSDESIKEKAEKEKSEILSEINNLGIFKIREKREREERLNTIITTIDKCNGKIKQERFSISILDFCLGNTDSFFFGQYPKDGENQSIEWKLVRAEDNRVLIISKYAIDSQQYNFSRINCIWEKCSLRYWLNETFLKTAFSTDEITKIKTTTVTADKNPEYHISAGNDTNDLVFLLSIAETEKFFASDAERQCKPTSYAEKNGAYIDNSTGNCWWWLRSPGNKSGCAAYVSFDGSVFYEGYFGDYKNFSVRPAMWISLE